MEIFNHWLFFIINASHQPSPAALNAVTLLAELPLFAVPFSLLVMWMKDRDSKAVAFNAGLNALIALSCNFAISLIWFHSRPFADHLGMTLIQHAADSSFPSDHVTLIASVGIFLYLEKTYRKLGGILLALSFIAGWARIFVGVHYPLDILGAYLLSALISLLFYKHLYPLLSPVVTIVIRCESTFFHYLKTLKSTTR